MKNQNQVRKDKFLHVGPEYMHVEDKQFIINAVNQVTGWTDLRKISYWLTECDGWDLVPQMGAGAWYRSFVKQFV